MRLMHAINTMLGNNVIGNSISQAGLANMAQHNLAAQSMLGSPQQIKSSSSQTVFNGRINVEKVANGYVINIATREGYAFDTYIASTIQEVNERIAASMVSFQLEHK